jgi:type II secretory pathway component PulF
MNWEELAFVNQQLAAMLRDGIPLEGALRKLCEDMRRGALRAELEALRADLERGAPLAEALAARNLPPLYVRMVQVGIKSGDLPAVLTLLADHYERLNLVWTRLKGLMIYPLIVLVAALGLSAFLTVFAIACQQTFVRDLMAGKAMPAFYPVALWSPLILLIVASVVTLVAFATPQTRRWLRWHVSGFKETSLSQLASAMSLMLRGGCTLAEAIGLLQWLERGTPVEADLARWQQRLRAGQSRFADVAGGSKIVPPLFVWLVASAAEGLPSGFRRATEFYSARAAHQTEVLLYAALPVAVLFLGGLILVQLSSVFSVVISILGTLGE